MTFIQIVSEPAISPISTREFINDRNEKAAQETPNPKNAEVQREANASELRRNLVVEELLQTHHREHVSDSDHDVLRNQPPHAHRLGAPEPPGLDQSRGRHHEHGDEDSGPYPLKRRDAGSYSGELSGDRD